MSYICECCGVRPERCVCLVALTEHILEDDCELGPLPKFMRQTNMPLEISFPDEPLVCDGPISNLTVPPIPKLERQTNMPPGIKFSDEDLQDLKVELFPEEEAHFQYLKGPHSPEYLRLSEKLFNAESYEKFCSTLVEMKDLYDLETSVVKQDEAQDELSCIDYCETCCNFLCDCDKMIPCDCGNLYHIDEPYGMCFTCEMTERRQDSIDQQLYPDDIRERCDSH